MGRAVICPHCRQALRLKTETGDRSAFDIRCPGCRQMFRARLRPVVAAEVLIGHRDTAISRLLVDRLQQLNATFLVCRDGRQVIDQLSLPVAKVLLLDVAFDGSFPVELIEKARRHKVKVVLFPSVYNKTAYKKKPDSLYGADAYIELHHIEDQLLPLLIKLVPEFHLQAASFGHSVPSFSGLRSTTAAP